MATSKIKAIKNTLRKAIDYIINPEKTDDGQLVYSHGCSVGTADIEMVLTAKHGTGRGNRIAYHLIQSFSPDDDITPERALELGKEFAQKVTGGNCEFVIATHIDKEHIHNHIIFNSVNYVDYTKYHSDNKDKYRIRDINDEICKANNLSVLPKYDAIRKKKYEDKHKKETVGWKSKLQKAIDQTIQNVSSFDEFLYEMEMEGYEIKKGKHIAFHASGQEREGRAAFTRAKSIGDNYTEEAIRRRIENKDNEFQEKIKENKTQDNTQKESIQFNAKKPEKKTVEPVKKTFYQKRINLLVDISKNIKAQQSKGYEQALVRSNINTLNKTMNYLIEHKITTSDEFQIFYEGKNAENNLCRKRIRRIENELLDLSEKIKFTQNYKKYAAVSFDSKRAKNTTEFYREHEDELVLFKASEMYFERKQINPKDMNLGELFNRYKELKEEKTELSKSTNKLKKEIDELNIITKNIENALDVKWAEDDNQTNNNRENSDREK